MKNKDLLKIGAVVVGILAVYHFVFNKKSGVIAPAEVAV